ncbi:hypothetical protein KP509_15G072500 [Ceratopteris richardii]|uniref:CUE domain-containing protein n=1 Tax=Ceratopteris richardii TaxID=49495 RepID=A0A8T2T8H1_CERRI|nr:hypothetical protein KP509_15G072500 [Ceratopteris richardii]
MNPVSTLSSKRTLLNPNAREFVPTSLKPSSSAALPTIGDETEPSTASDNGITISEKTVSSDTCLSDEESRKYWNAQLPDDILTPDTDFFIADAEDGIEPGSSISGASGSESSGIRDQSDYPTDDLAWERSGMYGKFLHDPVQVVSYDSAASHDIPRQLWEGEHTSSPYRFSPIIGSRSKQDSLPSTFDQVSMKDTNIVDPWHVLLSEFPNIPVRTLVDVYQANGGDLSLTMRELSRMKMQDEANLWHNVPLSTQFSPDLRPFSFSDPSTPEFVSRVSHVPEGVGMQHAGFTRVMRKNNSQWFYDHRGPSEFSLAPSVLPAENFSSKLLDGEPYGNRIESLHLHHKHRISSRNLADTDDALVSLRSELVREEARNHGRVRNAFMEQVCSIEFGSKHALS